jgi:hypothetical protein
MPRRLLLGPPLLLALVIAAACAGPSTRARAGTAAAFPPQTKTSGCQAQNAEPDPACTPGSVFPNAGTTEICVSGYASRARDVGVDEKRQAYTEYGLSYPQAPGAYEADHLVPLELGGSNEIANLWPEAAAPTPGFHQKDGLEDWLHDQVCAGAIDLTTAQQEIATDWRAAWETAGEPSPTYSGANPGEGTSGGQAAGAGPPPSGSGAAPATPSATATAAPDASSADGHTYYASRASNASTIYCDDDPVWQNLSARNLVSYPSLAAAMAALPNDHLHQPC